MTKRCNAWLWYAAGAKWKITSLKVPLGINGWVRLLFYQSFSLWSRYFDKHVFRLNVLIISRTCSRENSHSVIALMFDIAWNRSNICSVSDCNGTRTHNHLVCTWTLNHLAKMVLAKWLSVCLQTKWLWVWIPLQSQFFNMHVLLGSSEQYS